MKSLNLGSEIGKVVAEIEKLMNDNNIAVEGNNMVLNVKGIRYNIGRDCDTFPRYIEEPFWRSDI